MRKVLVALILFFVITLCILITVFLIEPDDKYIDLETSKKNIIEYSNQIDDVFESNGYDPEEIISDDDYIREDTFLQVSLSVMMDMFTAILLTG